MSIATDIHEKEKAIVPISNQHTFNGACTVAANAALFATRNHAHA